MLSDGKGLDTAASKLLRTLPGHLITDTACAAVLGFSEQAFKSLLESRKEFGRKCKALHFAECCRQCDSEQCRPCLLEYPAELQEACGLPPPLNLIRKCWHFPGAHTPGHDGRP
jgi:hypothetical protein